MDFVSILGLVAGLCTTAAVVPQIIKAWKTKKTTDISPLMFSILIIGLGLWVVYGFIKDDFPIIATNGLAFILNIIMLLFMFRYRNNG